MKASRPTPSELLIEFESEEELRAEYESNLSVGGLRVPTAEKLPNFAAVALRLRLGGKEATAKGTVVGLLPGALALAVEGKADELLAALTAPPEAAEAEGSTWDRLRSLSRLEKLMLAPKAERNERAILMQETDPAVLFALLKNPRIGAEEVARIAKSTSLSFQMAELITKTTQWSAHLDVKLALVHNSKTPPPMSLRILPTLPIAEVAKIARGAAVNQQLKQAALKIMIATG